MNDEEKFLFDHLYVYNNKVYELRNRDCLIDLFEKDIERRVTYSDSNFKIQNLNLVALPNQNKEIAIHYLYLALNKEND